VRLLVVNDKEGYREQLRQLFIHEGYKVITAASEEEALAALEASSPDIVITDVVMSHGDGFSILQRVQERDPRCPVIVITAYGSQESAVKALRLGAHDYVTKPFDQDAILMAVERAAEHRCLQQALVEFQEKLAVHVSEMSALYNTSLDLVSSLSLPQALESIISRAAGLLRARGGSICLVDEGRKQLTVAASHGQWADLTGRTLALGEDLAGKVAQNKRPLRADDYSTWEGRSLGLKDASCVCLVGVPLMVRDRVVGVLVVEDDTRRGGFSEADEALLLHLAPLAALAIERARLYGQTQSQLAEVRRAHQEITALQDLTAAIQSSLALPEVLHRIAEVLVQGLGYRAAMVAVYDPRQDALVVKAAVLDPDVWQQGEALAGMSLIGAGLTMEHDENLAICAARRREMDMTHHLADLFRPAVDEETAQVLQQMAGVRTLATVPLVVDGRLVGNFFAGSHRSALGSSDIASLQAFARQAALAIEHARLFELEQNRREIAIMLTEVSRVINSTLQLEEVLNLVLEGLESVKSDCSAVLLLERDSLRVKAVRGPLGAGMLDANIPVHENLVIGSVMDSRQPLVIADVGHHPGWYDAPHMCHFRGWIGAPLIARDQVIGLLMVGSAQASVYDEGDVQIVMTLAQQAAAAITNARFYAQAERNWREQRYLQEIAHDLNATLDLEQVLMRVMAKTNELLGVEAGTVVLLSEDRQELVFHTSVGGRADVVKGLRIQAGEGIVGWVISHGQSLLVPDVAHDPRHYAQLDAESGFKTRSILCVPLMAKGTVIGAIEVLNKIGGSFNAGDQRMMEALALSAATAIENAKLFQREKQAIDKLRQAQGELVRAQRLAALGQIGVTVRHEVNNPLTVVLGNADWLLEEFAGLDGELLRALEAIRANALRIRDIVDKLNDIRSDRVTEYANGIEMIDIHDRDVEVGQGEETVD
jgi:GAF domain-containing protein/FixJ family two-component response regulator